MRILKVDEIGNMISIEDMKETILDAMSRCEKGSKVYITYSAVLRMLTELSDEYDAEVFSEKLINEIFSKN